MSGVLEWLVARARGGVAEGELRPRLPARFEGPAAAPEHGDGETTASQGPDISRVGRDRANDRQHDDQVSRAAPEQGPNAPFGPDAPRAGAEIHGAAHESERARDARRDDAHRHPKRPAQRNHPWERSSRAERGKSETLASPPPRDLPHIMPDPDPAQGQQAGKGAPESPVAPAPSTWLEAGPRTDGSRHEAPPVPLMPVNPSPSFASPEEAPRHVAVSVQGTAEASSHAAAASEPDIVIHIGRIDLKAPAEAAPQAQPRPARKQMTTLADYLAGRGGGR